MKRADIVSLMSEFCDEIGIPASVRGVRTVPSSVELTVVARGHAHTVKFAAGLPRTEVMAKLATIEQAWRQRVIDGQADIEDYAIDAAE